MESYYMKFPVSDNTEPQAKVLTMWQPYATLLIHKFKLLETRPKPTMWEQEKGIYLIHAAKKFTKDQFELCEKEPFKSALNSLGIYCWQDIKGKYRTNLILGEIIGSIEVVDCRPIHKDENGIFIHEIYRHKASKRYIKGNELSFGDYRENRFAWITENPKILKQTFPFKGAQGYYVPYFGNLKELEFFE